MASMHRCIFFIWTHGEDKLKTFLENLNQFHPNIKFKHDSSAESIPFLDLSVKLLQGKFETNLHIKLSGRHQYFYYSSSHPGQTKRSIVYSQTLRVSRVCSHEADFRKYTTKMKSWFLKRRYPNDVIQKEMKKVKFFRISSARKDNIKGVPLVVSCHSGLKILTKLSTEIYTSFIWVKKVRKYLLQSPWFLSIVAGKLSSYLVRAKL